MVSERVGHFARLRAAKKGPYETLFIFFKKCIEITEFCGGTSMNEDKKPSFLHNVQ